MDSVIWACPITISAPNPITAAGSGNERVHGAPVAGLRSKTGANPSQSISGRSMPALKKSGAAVILDAAASRSSGTAIAARARLACAGMDDASVVARVMGSADVPLHIVTAFDGRRRDGCLVGFATQASIDPGRLLVCLSVANLTYRVAAGSQVLAVHLVPRERHDMAELFGGETGDEMDKLARTGWTPGPHGAPLLDACPVRMVGTVESRHPFGDHEGFLLAPIRDTNVPQQDALHVREAFDIEPGHPA